MVVCKKFLEVEELNLSLQADYVLFKHHLGVFQYFETLGRCYFLKLVSAIFYQKIFFSPNDSPSKTEKCFLFHLKSTFHSQEIQLYVIFPLPFLIFRFKSRSESRIIYDVMNCLALAGVTF